MKDNLKVILFTSIITSVFTACTNTQSSINKYTYSNLHSAVRLNQLENVKSLVKNNKNIDKKDQFGDTPLIDAVRANYTDIAIELICNNANINVKDKNNYSLINMAIRNNNNELIHILNDNNNSKNCSAKGNTKLTHNIIFINNENDNKYNDLAILNNSNTNPEVNEEEITDTFIPNTSSASEYSQYNINETINQRNDYKNKSEELTQSELDSYLSDIERPIKRQIKVLPTVKKKTILKEKIKAKKIVVSKKIPTKKIIKIKKVIKPIIVENKIVKKETKPIQVSKPVLANNLLSKSEFKDAIASLEGKNITFDKDTMVLSFFSSYRLNSKFKNTLNDIIPKLLSTVNSNKELVNKIEIKNYTSSKYKKLKNKDEIFKANSIISQRRADNIKKYILTLASNKHLSSSWLSSNTISQGMSSQNLYYDNIGNEDKKKSRRTEIKIILK